ncbi:hypothetical protein AN639_11685 [Candidatus Epulonipiscium fishelsonii]|uniref:Uncharacterized protein n=1 Tax=Candidatus Epulonipiscium fishelsonii TaxID=77094 RepID=A0ACC8XG03_9FIRM|nr:hypothetical protein AN396_01790 [Epulopiscium sp. SCG-B11WGA-EpuloA1]ONI42972.1 hypothetical protein AN639_11685 [Epulopiscium sp. SCG-B05WGA-EpuloA1]ONI48022.1 hypothetical protein AN644_02940 [Epulopiscium sp. SCG-C06WGA-EpuloA1]
MYHIEEVQDTMNEKICNCCGRPIKYATSTGVYNDYLHITKSWGYFSKKDLNVDKFNICETCYDRWVHTFKIPIQTLIDENVFKNLE